MCAKFHCLLKSAWTFRHLLKTCILRSTTVESNLSSYSHWRWRLGSSSYSYIQGYDLLTRRLSTNKVQTFVASNCRPSTIFNLLLIFLAKVRNKKPASKSWNNYTAVDCRRYKNASNNKKIESYQLREGKEASGRLRLHERMALSRREASIRPAHARRFRDHLGTDTVRSKLPPLCVPVSPSPVSREISRDLWRSIRPSTMGVFKLRTSV